MQMKQLDTAFQALSDPTRRAILQRLTEGEASAGELAAPFDISQPAVSRHLKTLQNAGLVTQRREGTRRLFSLSRHRLEEMNSFLDDLEGSVPVGTAASERHASRRSGNGHAPLD